MTRSLLDPDTRPEHLQHACGVHRGRLGTIFYTPTLPSPLVTWFDDLAIDDTQIGCN